MNPYEQAVYLKYSGWTQAYIVTLTPAYIRSMTSKELSYLTPTQLSYFSKDQANAIDFEEQGDSLSVAATYVINSIKYGQQIDPTLLKRLQDNPGPKAYKQPVINCEGSWSPCDFATGLRTYRVTQMPGRVGKPCVDKYGNSLNTGVTRPCSHQWGQDLRNTIAGFLTTRVFLIVLFIVLFLSAAYAVLSFTKDFLIK